MALLLLALLAAAPPGPAGGSLERAAAQLAEAATATPQGTAERIALAVLAPGADGLREPLETALAAALARRGAAVVPLRGAPLSDPERGARAVAADYLLRVRAALSGGALALAGEVIPVRPNFFLQALPGARPAGSRLVSCTVEADATVRALAGLARPGAGALAMVPLADLGERVLALAAGTTGDGAVRLVAITPARIALLDARGAVLASRALPPPPDGPRVRDAAAAVAVGDFGAGRIAYAVAGQPGGEILSAAGDRLERVGPLEALAGPAERGGAGSLAPVAAGAAGPLFGWFVRGRGVLADALSRTPATATAARAVASGRALLGAAAAPRPGRLAYAVLGDDFALRLLGPSLDAVHPDLPGAGAGFALADLDGDGEPEVVISAAVPGALDRARVVRPGAPPQTSFESAPVPGQLLCGAAADVTGDGLDDAVLAAALPGGGTRLWLLTMDASWGRR